LPTARSQRLQFTSRDEGLSGTGLSPESPASIAAIGVGLEQVPLERRVFIANLWRRWRAVEARLNFPL